MNPQALPADAAGFDTDVLVVGAGPVGLTLVMDLAGRGVRVTVAELRAYGEPPNVKCNHVASRTMERFRQLGVANRVFRPSDAELDFARRLITRYAEAMAQGIGTIDFEGKMVDGPLLKRSQRLVALGEHLARIEGMR